MPLKSTENASQDTLSVPHLPSYNEAANTSSTNESPTTWRDLETVVLRSGISAAWSNSGTPSYTREVVGPGTTEPIVQSGASLVEHLVRSAIILSSVQSQVREELDGLMHDFDEEWLAVQQAAYAFYNHTRALANCGRRLYAVQEHWYTTGQEDMAMAIDPFLEVVDVRMPAFGPLSPAIISTGA